MEQICPVKGAVKRYSLPGPAASQSPCRGWCRQIPRCTPSLTWRLSASLSLGSALTRRSRATSGSCWASRRLATMGVKGVRWQGTSRSYLVGALCRLKHAFMRSWAAMQYSIFKRCRRDSRRALTSTSRRCRRGSCSSVMSRRCKVAAHPNTNYCRVAA